jgi:threonine/homoserine/homoserine lactone efflux protein
VGQGVGNLLPLAVAVAVFPVPIIAVVLVLGSPHGRTKGLAFVFAWLVGLGAVGALVLLFAGALDASESGEPATWVNVVLLALGVLLLVLAAKQWRGRPRVGDKTPVPGWMSTIDEFTTAKAAGAGFALSALNPKNVLLTVAAAAEIAERGLPAGEQAVVVETPVGPLGLSICYDLRFPELYRALVDRGAELLVVPAAFTLQTGKDHWHVLLRARAIESQCFVLAAGQWGKHPLGRMTYGHSMGIDPWGTIVAEASDRVGVVMVDALRADITRVRTSLPSLRHRRL